MKHPAFVFTASMLLVVTAAAKESQYLSDEATNAVYDRVESQRQPQAVASPDQQLKAVYRQTHPGVYGLNAGRVAIFDRSGQMLATHVFADLGGRLVAIAHWSPDSKFCVFTTISAGGHSPWHFDPYVFSAASRKFRLLGDGAFAAVIDPEFRVTAPATALFTTRQGTIPLQLDMPNKQL